MITRRQNNYAHGSRKLRLKNILGMLLGPWHLQWTIYHNRMGLDRERSAMTERGLE